VLEEHLEHVKDGHMTIEFFTEFQHSHKVLFHDIFTIQRRIKKRTLGIPEWHAISKRRIEIAQGRKITLADLLLLVSVLVFKLSF
jgi:hypothetical protein